MADFDDMFDDRTEEEKGEVVEGGEHIVEIEKDEEEEFKAREKKEEIVPPKKDDFYGDMQKQVDDLIKTEKAKNRPDTRVILEALKLKADLQDKKMQMATNLLKMTRAMKQKTPEQRSLL